MENTATLELIPISIIEGIIKDDDEYRKFMTREGTYSDINEEIYVKAINDYMTYATLHTNDLTEGDFNRVNYINLSHDNASMYSYQEYLAKTDSMITIDALERIISDEDTFNKFMNFDNNKDFFDNFPIIDYLDGLTRFISYYGEHDLSFSPEQIKRVNAIMKKHSLKLKRYHTLDGYNVPVEADVNAELFKKVLDKIDINREPFYIARAVYIELAKLVTYDPNFLALEQDVSIDEANSIYNKNITEISLTDNKVVCKDWAELYAFILNLLGIKAVVSGGFHKYVTFNCDGTLIKADATNTVFVSSDLISMPDIGRIQAGLSTGGYVCLESDKDISDLLNRVDEELGYTTSTIDTQMSELEERYLNIKNKEVNYEEKVFNELEFLRKVSQDSNLNNFELFKYINALANALFKKNNIYGVFTKFICVKGKLEEYAAATLVSYTNSSGEYQYIIFTKGLLTVVSKDDLIAMINREEIKILGKDKIIPGIDKENTNGVTK